MLVPDLIRRKSPLIKRLWIALFERRNIENAAAIQFTSQIEAEEFNAFGFRVPLSVVVPNGIDVPPLEAVIPSSESRRPYILYLGRISWKKRLDEVIRATAQLADIDLLIAGNDDEGLRPDLDKIAKQCGVADRVHFLGYVEGIKKWELLREARAFVLPSHSENFGMAVLEAMGAGCPVIVTPGVGLSDSIRHCGAGLVVEANSDAIANAVNTLLANTELSQKMREAGRRHVAEHYPWSRIARQVESLYQDVIERTSHRPHVMDGTTSKVRHA
jgi:glycosyltransferase involved in cell wall biosynthesis